MSKKYQLKLASAVVVNGQPAPAGSIVPVDEAQARRLLDAGKADLARMEDIASTTAGETPILAEASDAKPTPARSAKAKGETK
ncbi:MULTISPECIES: hypothetical protein [unclassified Paracoccus (in: a-proteobacteria)]|uniref:hypothetical protein n=1 Tax=unclassified Paracoccus (in: a-proteobacteria) TaxID=2688777 RepID=UPI0012B3A141|nr:MULTISPECIES: hypothetical protein [unclassified Paracoccus (in: a-proteobacteria)]UXU73700.1 hypothetical protein GB879_007040 [Paracoccus sp. SMMA_5]UXU79590.1 hypothetical protein GB880_007030 [Paracoccus sp. SMMA_5_TC]